MHFKYNSLKVKLQKKINQGNIISDKQTLKQESFLEIIHTDKTSLQENKSILNLYASTNNFKIYKAKIDKTERRNRGIHNHSGRL